MMENSVKKNMLNACKLENNTKYHQEPLEISQSQERLDSLDKEMEDSSTMSMTSTKNSETKPLTLKRKLSCIQESHRVSKKKTSSVKRKCLENIIQVQKVSQTLEADSILKEKAFKPFWNQFSRDMSQKLWLPIETDSVDLDSTYLNKSVDLMKQKSWFSIKQVKASTKNSKTTLSPSVHSLLLKHMDEEEALEKKELEEKRIARDTKPLKQVKTRKIKLKLNTSQKILIKKWMGTSRWTYNQCVAFIKKQDVYNRLTKMYTEIEKYSKKMDVLDIKIQKCKSEKRVTIMEEKASEYEVCIEELLADILEIESKLIDQPENTLTDTKKSLKMILREKFKNKMAELVQENNWVLETPEQIRDFSLCEFLVKLKEARRVSLETGIPFEMKFRSKKRTNVITIQAREFQKYEMFSKSKLGVLVGHERLLKAEGAVTINLDRLGNYYISIPIEEDVGECVNDTRCENQAPKIIALDPGVRKFLVGYDMERIVEFGNRDFGYISRILKRMDALQSKMTKVNCRRRKRMKKAWFRYIYRVKNLIQECHNQIIRFLLDTYDIIFLPEYKSSQMLPNLSSKVARNMSTWAFYRFKTRLLWKAKVVGKRVAIVTEEFTSQTCICGSLTKTKNELFKCKDCGFEMDRDHLAARNIFIKTYTCRLRPRTTRAVLPSTLGYEAR
eukprot:NODE_297_length_11469_cov_0.855937.p1 type:complete len:672 gc:universal NODE_297_length_11469_cov_0.855937:3488-1473(-)